MADFFRGDGLDFDGISGCEAEQEVGVFPESLEEILDFLFFVDSRALFYLRFFFFSSFVSAGRVTGSGSCGSELPRDDNQRSDRRDAYKPHYGDRDAAHVSCALQRFRTSLSQVRPSYTF